MAGKSKQASKAKAAPRRKAAKPNKDTALILARAEQIIDLLGGNYFVCEGWKMDQEAATHTLQYLRRIAAGAPEIDREWKAVCDFFHDHGQSIDWIAMGDPGVMICRLASHSARRFAVCNSRWEPRAEIPLARARAQARARAANAKI